MHEECHDSPLPFLKWAGGKRWLVNQLPGVFPTGFNRYIEPFLGSAAVFFALQPKKTILSDINCQLIETYVAIQRDWRKVASLLRKHQRLHTKKHYYSVRKCVPRTMYTRAARLIYLNRTCWNGLFRVNKEGHFNVPIGTKKNVLLESDNFERICNLLRTVVLMNSDFERTIALATKGDLIFADPPYTVKHNNNGFIKYNEKLFSWQDQVRLKMCLLRAKERGAFVVATNADSPSIRRLYAADFSVHSVQRTSVIAADAHRRGTSSELLIRGW